jgi:hypothetical protein
MIWTEQFYTFDTNNNNHIPKCQNVNMSNNSKKGQVLAKSGLIVPAERAWAMGQGSVAKGFPLTSAIVRKFPLKPPFGVDSGHEKIEIERLGLRVWRVVVLDFLRV